MSDRNDTQQDTEPDTQQDTEPDTQPETGRDDAPEDSGHEADVKGVDLDPEDNKKSLEVDTDERLQAVDDRPDFDDLSDDELEKEREERLAPENRPETAEIDNSQRTFNPETGLFEDSEMDEPPAGAPFATVEGEKPGEGSEDSGGSDDDGSKDSDDMDPMDASDEDAEDPKDRTEATDAEQSKEAKESKDTEG